MKLFSVALICFLLSQAFVYPLLAIENPPFYLAADKKGNSDEAVDHEKENSPSKTTNHKKDKEEEYHDRSVRGSKFVFSDLPRHLGYDIRDSFWGWGALAFGLGIGATAILHTQDKQIQYSFAPNHLFGYTGNKIFDYSGAPYTMAGVGVIVTAVGAGIKDVKLRTTGESILESLFWAELITIGAKYAFDRNRPDGSRRGFPSAHASGVFSTATVLEMMYGPKIGVPAYLFATLVAVSRVDSYNHFPSDVLMGAVIGSVVAYGTTRFHKKLHGNFQLMPEVGMNHVGLSIHRSF